MLEERGKLALARKAVLLLRLIAFASAPPGPGGSCWPLLQHLTLRRRGCWL